MLTNRWTTLDYHSVQQRYWRSQTRFNVCHAGRRSGKTELAKRKIVKKAMSFLQPRGRFVCGAPTHRQAVEIFWDDIIDLIPTWMLRKHHPIVISDRTIYLITGTKVQILGMDKAERVEGPPLDGFVGDEFGNFKEGVWERNVRPALSTKDRPGWADLIGVPEGKNHYFTLTEDAKNLEDWDVFTWTTYDIDPKEAEAARSDVDDLTYQQEYGGAFVSFKGLAYYTYSMLNHPPSGIQIVYDPNEPLIFCHDFNRRPGTCLIVQEQDPPEWLRLRNQKTRGKCIAIIDEVFQREDSNTEKVCDELLRKWSHHKGHVFLHGDATGGAHTSQGVAGSDWEIIRDKLRSTFHIKERFPRANPPIRSRLNSTNTQLRSADGYINLIVDPIKTPMICRDFEGVSCDDEGSLEKNEAMLSHISDALSYYVHEAHPYGGGKIRIGEI